MARSAGGMDFRIRRVNRVPGGGMTTGALSGHQHPAGVIDTGMIIHKGAMTG